MAENMGNSVKKIIDSANNVDIPLGTIISPSGTAEGLMILRNENRAEPNLLKSLVYFIMNSSPCLASIGSVSTSNPHMDIGSKIGIGNMSYIANRGTIPHTEDADVRIVSLQFLSRMAKDGTREKMMTSPDIGLDVLMAKGDVMQAFYPFAFPGTIAVGRYRGMEIPVPLDVAELKSVHCGIFGETGWGKSILQAFLASALVRAGCKLLIFDHSGDYSSDKTSVNMIFARLVGAKNKNYSVFQASRIKADYDLLRVKIDDEEFWNKIFQTTPEYAKRIANEIVDLIESKFTTSGLQGLEEKSFLQIVRETVPNIWSTDSIMQQKKQIVERKAHVIKDWFNNTIRPYVIRPLSFEDIYHNIKKMQAIVIDLSGENMTDSEKALYVAKIGQDVLAEGNAIYPKAKLNLVTILDEAHIYVPQIIKDVRADYWIARSKKTVIEIAKQGRKYGLGLCLADQRITAVDKQAIDLGTYFLGKLKLAGERAHIREMFGGTEADALRTLKKYQFMVIGNSSPLEDVTAPIQVFDPASDLDFVEEIHTNVR